MDTKIRHSLGELTDIEAVRQFIALEGLSVADIGCGPGKVTYELCQAGAMVVGIEPDKIQAAKNRNLSPPAGLRFMEACAENLPLESASLDAVFFFRSLHHVPIEAMDAALAEANRVLKPDTGVLWVVEPSMEGSHFRVMRPFNDETIVRTEAQAALGRTAARLFKFHECFTYVQFPRYPSFEAMAERISGQTFNNIRREDIETEEVRALFEAERQGPEDYKFEQPMLLNIYKHNDNAPLARRAG